MAPARRRNGQFNDIAAIRRRLGLTQREFAGWFGFPIATLRHWERGNRRPAGAALVLLHVIASHPRAVITTVRKLRAANPAMLAEIEPRESARAPPGLGYRL